MQKQKYAWKIRQEKRNKISLYLPLYGVLVCGLVIAFFLTINASKEIIEPNFKSYGVISRLPENQETTLYNKIKNYASSYQVDASKALEIAICESQMGKYLFNFEGGSAKGIYQFTDRTFKAYCEGNVLNTNDNIKCFMKLYNKHKSWWKCQA